VTTVQESSGEKIIAVGRYIKNPGTSTAEVAFLVRDQWHHKGIGTFLMEYLAKIAKENGLTGFTSEVLHENKDMLEVIYKSPYKVTSRFEDGVYHLSFSFLGEYQSNNSKQINLNILTFFQIVCIITPS
ncbi:MAG: GNAT family N-acetyltransferase, partial [Deltaproteobacteria bacterium]|nr:GNAT family N-acetyltransferase [Deltaproteobacteria bacterium]